MINLLSFVAGFLFSFMLVGYILRTSVKSSKWSWLVPIVLSKLDLVLPDAVKQNSKEQLTDLCLDVIQATAQESDVSIPLTDAKKVLSQVVSTYSFLENAAKLI
jgi:hypothetical protein